MLSTLVLSNENRLFAFARKEAPTSLGGGGCHFIDEKYVWKPGMFGVTEESYELLEVNAKVIMNGNGEVK